MVPVDLGMPPISGILRDPCMIDDILEIENTILEYLWEAYAFDHGP
jgi:hypothetical protein